MFITIEGIDGSGKSIQARLLKENLEKHGLEACLTREPGDWSDGEKLREILLGGHIEHPMTETLLFLADRCENLRQVIEPALEAKKTVICDRYNDSTIAYQSFGRGMDKKRLDDLFMWCGFRKPDVTFWIDVPVEEAISRLLTRDGNNADRFQKENLDFHNRLRQGFSALAQENPNRIIRIDGTQTVDQIAAQILDAVLKRRK